MKVPPECPRGHGPMELFIITQGEGEDEKYLGRFWGCVNDDRDKPDYCDECVDCDESDEPAEDVEIPTVTDEMPPRYFQMSFLRRPS